MAMAPNVAQFSTDLQDLWVNADEDTTVYETGDLIQGFWENSRVTGYEITPPIVPPESTYPGLAPMANPTGMTALLAAQAIENACLTMCVGTLYTIVAPPVTTPPPFPLPGGLAIPGLLATTLTAIFEAGAAPGNETPTAPLIVTALVGYLASWVILVTIPPAGALSVPII